ncbi:signal recognition particle-docking protein FtsY [Lactiplantibacillus pentosus]|uniref:signal recognition particle-docking protein FtsY n=1 Tax=Lactiplantibacillus pentosus TaxID=1589 RepID=UPI003770746E
MGLFSRLKKAFSLPESDDSQANSTASAASATASQASAPTSAASNTTSQQSMTAVNETTTSESSANSSAADSTSAENQHATVAASEADVREATVEAQTDAQSQVDVEPTEQSAADNEEATVSAAPLTASEMVAQSLAALRESAAQAGTAKTSEAPVSSDTAVASQSAPVESVASQVATQSEETVTDQQSTVETTPAAENKDTSAESETPATTEAEANDEPTEAERYDRGLKKSRKTFGDRINAFLANFRHVDEAFFDDLEDTLIESDVGYETAMRISDELRDEVKLKNAKSKKEISSVIVEKLVDMYGEAGEGEDNSIHMAASAPTVILFVGVNGAGKTTTIGKMANMYKQQGKKVLLAACDTFRAGAIQQLQVWGQRDGVDVVAKAEKSDPASVCFDAVKKAKAEDYDVLFVDTAGRLQNKVNLMNELEKIKRVITREIPDAPHEVLLVLDATTGQNALNQAKLFKQSTDVSGIVLTKLDGTARGGIVLAIRNELHLAVKYVGLGEKVTDLRPFNANDFVYGLFKDIITG